MRHTNDYTQEYKIFAEKASGKDHCSFSTSPKVETLERLVKDLTGSEFVVDFEYEIVIDDNARVHKYILFFSYNNDEPIF